MVASHVQSCSGNHSWCSAVGFRIPGNVTPCGFTGLWRIAQSAKPEPTMKPDISSLNLNVAFEQLRRREYTALELTEACLRQIARLNPTFNAFITPMLEQAVQAAMQADVLYKNPSFSMNELPLLGIPLGIKDL